MSNEAQQASADAFITKWKGVVASPAPLSIEEIGTRFTARGPWKKRLPQLLDMLVALGRAELRSGGAYGAMR